MILNRLVGGCLTAISFILLGLVLTTRGSSTLGIEVMDRLGLTFAVLFIAAQFVICLIFLRPSEFWVPLLLLIGGTVLFVYQGGPGMGRGSLASFEYALFGGASMSGLASGILAILGKEEVVKENHPD